jgi:urease accessory protein
MPSDHAQNSSPSANELAQLRLLHLADTALPIGALSHSFGLETLSSNEMLTVADLANFLEGFLHEAGMLEAVACRTAFRLVRSNNENFPAASWLELNDHLSALKPARESREGSAALGRNFLKTVLALDENPTLREALESARSSGTLVHHNAAFGLASAALHFDEHQSTLAFLHQLAANLVSCCQRLLPLGQTGAGRILWNVKPVIAEVSNRSANCTLSGASSFTPLLDWGAMEHPALQTRLFIS